MKPQKHSKAAEKAHPAPDREAFTSGEDYAKAFRLVSDARSAFDAPKPTTVQMLDEVGVEAICRRIIEGESMTAIAASFGLGTGSLRYWVSLDISRSARVREARALTGAACDDEALDRIDAASDPFELAKAREAAQHLRWRAKAIAPKEYGEKVSMETTIKYADLTDEQIDARLAALEAV